MHEQSPSGSHSQPQHGSENTDFVLESQGFSVSVRTWDLEALLLPFPLTLSVVILCTRSGLPVQTENHAPAAGYLLGSGVATTPATPGLPVRSSGSRQFGLPQRTEPNGETPGSVAPRHSEPAQGAAELPFALALAVRSQRSFSSLGKIVPTLAGSHRKFVILSHSCLHFSLPKGKLTLETSDCTCLLLVRRLTDSGVSCEDCVSVANSLFFCS